MIDRVRVNEVLATVQFPNTLMGRLRCAAYNWALRGTVGKQGAAHPWIADAMARWKDAEPMEPVEPAIPAAPRFPRTPP